MEGEGDKFDNFQASFSSKIKLRANLQTLCLTLALCVRIGVAVVSFRTIYSNSLEESAQETPRNKGEKLNTCSQL